MAMTCKDGKKILKFGLVGVANTFVDCVILNAIVFILNIFSPIGLALCNVVSFLGANINSYLMNKRWTFENRNLWSKKEYSFFLLCSLGGLAINCGVIFFLSHRFLNPQWSLFANLNAAKLLATVASMVWNFCSYRYFVFKQNSSEIQPIKKSCHGSSAPFVRG